jgi:hypothetical protein
MKVCTKCNAHYENDTFFCLQDGTPLEKTDSVRIIPDNPADTDETPAAFPSEETVVKNKVSKEENISEDTITRPNNISEETITLPKENKSVETVVYPVEQKSEPTLVLPKPKATSESKPAPQTATKIGSIPLQSSLDSLGSDSSYVLRTTGIGAVLIVLVTILCAFLGGFNSSPTGTSPSTNENSVEENANTEITLKRDTPQSKSNEPDGTTVPLPPPFGKISGTLTYPSEGVPTDLMVCVEEITDNITLCSDGQKSDEIFTFSSSSLNYSVELLDGTYYIYALYDGKKAYYTEFVRCGMNYNCKSHKKIPITLKNGNAVSGITLGDWYDF